MKYIKGYWWPDDVEKQYRFSLKRIKSLLKIIEICKSINRTHTIIQAGGSIGVWPRILASHFQVVYTFEPEHYSFECLCRNLEGCKNVMKFQAALGSVHEGVRIHKKKMTSHFINGTGPTLQLSIDSLPVQWCDAILLDVEGSESDALLGGISIIEKYHPLILVEARGKTNRQEVTVSVKETADFLFRINYRKVLEIELDDIYEYKEGI